MAAQLEGLAFADYEALWACRSLNSAPKVLIACDGYVFAAEAQDRRGGVTLHRCRVAYARGRHTPFSPELDARLRQSIRAALSPRHVAGILLVLAVMARSKQRATQLYTSLIPLMVSYGAYALLQRSRSHSSAASMSRP